MERNNELYLPWLEPLITTNFYGDDSKCDRHNMYRTFFCKECTDEPLCESCWKDAAEHKGHEFLQIFKEGSYGYPSCVICERRIKDEQYQFCSISCKTVGEKLMRGHSESESEICEENKVECSTQNYSLRKKSRKRRPYRSPLF
ncbi:hypothetical protein P3S68_025327 [Capsicum galapagoense]